MNGIKATPLPRDTSAFWFDSLGACRCVCTRDQQVDTVWRFLSRTGLWTRQAAWEINSPFFVDEPEPTSTWFISEMSKRARDHGAAVVVAYLHQPRREAPEPYLLLPLPRVPQPAHFGIHPASYCLRFPRGHLVPSEAEEECYRLWSTSTGPYAPWVKEKP